MQNAENASEIMLPMLGVAEEVKVVPSCFTFFLDTAFLGQCLHLQCSCDECVWLLLSNVSILPSYVCINFPAVLEAVLMFELRQEPVAEWRSRTCNLEDAI